MASLKVLAARSVAARVTSEESLDKLEVPASLLRDLLVAHRDSWLLERDDTRKNHSIPSNNENLIARTKIANLKHHEKRPKRSTLLSEESLLKLKKSSASKRHLPRHPGNSAPSVQMSEVSASMEQDFRLFAREVGPMVKAKYPNIQKIQFNNILARIWTEMPEQERDKYAAKADKLAQFQAGGTREILH